MRSRSPTPAMWIRSPTWSSVSQVPVLVLGGARSDNERDALELFAEGLEAGCSGCLMGRNVTKSPDPETLIRQLGQVAHDGYTVDDALRGREAGSGCASKPPVAQMHRLRPVRDRLRGRPRRRRFRQPPGPAAHRSRRRSASTR